MIATFLLPETPAVMPWGTQSVSLPSQLRWAYRYNEHGAARPLLRPGAQPARHPSAALLNPFAPARPPNRASIPPIQTPMASTPHAGDRLLLSCLGSQTGSLACLGSTPFNADALKACKGARMPVIKLTEDSPLSNPTATTAPLLKGISGRSGTTQPLTERSYKFLWERIEKLEKKDQQFRQYDLGKGHAPKLGFMLGRAKIPRAIALKMTDLTESYSEQMQALIKAAKSIESDEADPYGPELEGVLEKSHAMAQRFQQAMGEIEEAYAWLRQASRQAVSDAAKKILSMNTNDLTKEQLLKGLFERYNIDYAPLFNEQGGIKDIDIAPKLTLLPLLKGVNIYNNRKTTINHLLTVNSKFNQSKQRKNTGHTKNGTTIEMLYQVQPKFKTSVFSDHAGFVARFSHKGCPPLFVYYHSLEHGHQHTNTRTAWNYGSQSSLSMPVLGSGKNSPEKSTKLFIHDHRSAYLKNLQHELEALLPFAEKENGNVLVVIGECTLSIHKGVVELVSLTNQALAPKNQVLPLKIINASKPEYKKGKAGPGLGVHSLMGYFFPLTDISNIDLVPSLLTPKNKKDTTKQNMLTLIYGPQKEHHAIAHLLNGKEDALARELRDLGYASVGGDLNNITIGEALVETCDRKGMQLSMGSNSTGTDMYDKIVLL
jgi:hypothetical protein